MPSLSHHLKRIRWRNTRRVRQLYLESIKVLVLNSIYAPGDHISDGTFIPSGPALTMIGRKRLDNLQHCAEQVLWDDVPGDMIETGIWKGGAMLFMRAILKAYNEKTRTVFGADSFEGIPKADLESYPEDEPHQDAHKIQALVDNSQAEVEGYFRVLDLLDNQTVFVPGWFKDTLPHLEAERFSLIRLDGDLYESTWQALEALYPKLSPGGYIIIDDYEAFVGCQKAVNHYRAEHGIEEPTEVIDWTGVFWRKSG